MQHESLRGYFDIRFTQVKQTSVVVSAHRFYASFLMLKPIINQKWARPPTQWKASGAKAWQSPTSSVLPLSRLDNHPENVNVIVVRILSQVWMLPSSFLFDFFDMKEKSFQIIIHSSLPIQTTARSSLVTWLHFGYLMGPDEENAPS